MPKKQTAKKNSPPAKPRKPVKRVTDAELVVQYVTLDEQAKGEMTFDDFLNTRKITSVARRQKLNILLSKVVPVQVGQNEMEFLVGQMRHRNNLLELLKFPMDPEVQILVHDLKKELLKLKEYIKAMNDLGIDVSDQEAIKDIVDLLKYLIRLMAAAVSAKDIRQTLNDMDVTKQRIQFLKQL